MSKSRSTRLFCFGVYFYWLLSVFGRLSSVFGKLQNPVLLVLSSKNGGLEGLTNLLLRELEDFEDLTTCGKCGTRIIVRYLLK